ncbi:MAG: hypothetical protein ACM3X7_10460 [Solirubrobacterales bacterium]
MNTEVFVSILIKLGFTYVEETAVGAELISNYYMNYVSGKKYI